MIFPKKIYFWHLFMVFIPKYGRYFINTWYFEYYSILNNFLPLIKTSLTEIITPRLCRPSVHILCYLYKLCENWSIANLYIPTYSRDIFPYTYKVYYIQHWTITNSIQFLISELCGCDHFIRVAAYTQNEP